ncbi:hypothetical protein, partial [Streptococcus suis]|uniref:hypothetical protein n=1 Tax=Streptococcus suis TaxID=1307 RepID=UPI0021174C5D
KNKIGVVKRVVKSKKHLGMMPQSALYQGFTAYQNQMILFFQVGVFEKNESNIERKWISND